MNESGEATTTMTSAGQNDRQQKSSMPEKTVHILLTQCLQNGFFLSEDNRLCLPEDEVYRMLIGDQEGMEDKSAPYVENEHETRHQLKSVYQKGPLYQFLKTVIDKKNRQSDLHVIHLRDWHELSPEYDEERRLYGGHCEANTWEAMPIDGYETFLQPWAISKKEDDKVQAKNHPRSLEGWRSSAQSRKKVRFYEVLSDSVFDFRYAKSIDYLSDVEDECKGTSQSHLSVLLNRILEEANDEKVQVYVIVIGVYTDIKVRTLLTGLRSRYNEINSLVVSDMLTAAPSIDRHLGALDFIDKVLDVEVISNLNTIVSIMDKDTILENGQLTEEEPIPVMLTQSSLRWRDYRHYHLDKQIVLAYQDQSLAKYLKLTTERSNRLYNQIESINVWLMWFGRVALFSLAIFIVMSVIGYEVPLEALIFTGLVSTSQIIPVFIDTPQKRIQENLAKLVRLRNYLESYSMISALLRHHLTSPRQLSAKTTDEDEKLLAVRNERIKEHMIIIKQGADALRENFGDIYSNMPETGNAGNNTADSSE